MYHLSFGRLLQRMHVQQGFQEELATNLSLQEAAQYVLSLSLH